MTKSILLVLFFLIFGCSNKTEKQPKFTIAKSLKVDTIKKKLESEKDNTKTILEETLIDSTQIGIKGKFKLIIEQFRNSDSVYVEINLSEKINNKWILKQKIEYLKDGITNCDAKIQDFNNDGAKDLTFKSSVAARGANEIRKLFIFDKKNNKLILMKNSDNYPNLEYNKVLDCIDSWMVYGGTSTIFLKIEKDSLREFAGVSLFDEERKIYIIDKKGKQKTIKKEIVKNLEVYTRFKNYSPLIENTEAE
jgi:hypothetical protein